MASRFMTGSTELTLARLNEFGLPWHITFEVGDTWVPSVPAVLRRLQALGLEAYQRKGDKGISLSIQGITAVAAIWTDVVRQLGPCCHMLSLHATPELAVYRGSPIVFEAPAIVETDHRLLPYLWPSLHLGADMDAMSLVVRIEAPGDIGRLQPEGSVLRSLEVRNCTNAEDGLVGVLDSLLTAAVPRQRTTVLLLEGPGFEKASVSGVWQRHLFDDVLQPAAGAAKRAKSCDWIEEELIMTQ